LLKERPAITRMQGMVAVLVIVVAAGAGAYFLTLGQSSSGPGPILLQIIETDPVNQVDNLSPGNITVSQGSTITLAIQNHDDAPRSLVIAAFNVNQTIGSGATERITFTVGQPGVYTMFVPARPAFDGFKASPAISGYLIVS
jgi:Cupredoxin-like domain